MVAKKARNSIKLDRSSVKLRLGVCAAALGGTAAVVPETQAQIVSFNTPVPVPATFAGVYVNLGTGVTGGSGAGTPGWDFNPYAASSLTQLGFYWAPTPAGNSGGVVSGAAYADLTPGTVVSSASTFSNVILATTGSPYLTTGTHILGFKFNNESNGLVNFGYLTMTNTGGGTPNGFPTTILNWSYELSGGPITVAGVPEPSSILLTTMAMVAGARGVRRWRRQTAA
jgi:hypothetical protein